MAQVPVHETSKIIVELQISSSESESSEEDSSFFAGAAIGSKILCKFLNSTLTWHFCLNYELIQNWEVKYLILEVNDTLHKFLRRLKPNVSPNFHIKSAKTPNEWESKKKPIILE